MSATTILAIDLGKYKCVACVYNRATAAAEFRTRHHLPGRSRAADPLRPPGSGGDRGVLDGRVGPRPVRRTGVPCRVANTAAEAWKYKHTKRKTDRDDALRLGWPGA